MLRPGLTSAAIVLFIAGCGPISTAPSDGGTGSGGRSVDAGTSVDAGSGGGSTDAGSGGGAADGGSGGGTADAGSGGGSTDAGGGSGGGGGSGDECAGLGPGPVGAPDGSGTIGGDHFAAPLGATSDGSGVVALIGRGPTSGPPSPIYFDLYDRSGNRLGSYHESDTEVTEQLNGFIVSHTSGDLDGRGEVAAVDEHGNVTASTGLVHQIFDIAINPIGGVVAVGFVNGGDGRRPVTWYDDSVKARWQTTLNPPGAVWGFGVDRQGNTLVLFERTPTGSGKMNGIWIDRDGNPGREFDAGTFPGPLVLSPRVGNGLFLGARDGKWIAQFDPFAGPAAPPEWLASRPAGTTFHMARNGRAYAVIAPPVNAAGPCSTTIDVVAPSGKSCGTAEFTSTFDNGRCESTMWVGYDGTAIQRATTVPDPSRQTSGYTAPFRWWSGFFQ